MDKSEKVIAGVAVVGLGILAWLGARAPANAAAAAAATGKPPAPGADVQIGTGTPLQTRPVPDWASLSADGRASYVRTMQQQLNYLSFGPLPLNGDEGDAATMAAVNQFLGDEMGAARARAYGYGVGAGTPALIDAIDDAVRFDAGSPRAPDFRPPVAAAGTSGASSGVAAVRRRG